MFPMTITVHNASQLNAVLQAMQPDLEASDFKSPAVGAAYEEAKAKVEANKAAAGKPKAEKTATAKTEPAAPTSPTAEAGTSPAADALAKKDAKTASELGVEGEVATVTYDHVKAAILDVSKAKGREAALKLLAQFDAEKGPDLQKTPEKFGDFIAAAKKLLGA